MTRRMSLPGEGRSRFARLLFLLVLGAALTALLSVACGGVGTKVEPVPDPEPGANPKPGVVHTPPAEATQLTVALTDTAGVKVEEQLRLRLFRSVELLFTKA